RPWAYEPSDDRPPGSSFLFRPVATARVPTDTPSTSCNLHRNILRRFAALCLRSVGVIAPPPPQLGERLFRSRSACSHRPKELRHRPSRQYGELYGRLANSENCCSRRFIRPGGGDIGIVGRARRLPAHALVFLVQRNCIRFRRPFVCLDYQSQSRHRSFGVVCLATFLSSSASRRCATD